MRLMPLSGPGFKSRLLNLGVPLSRWISDRSEHAAHRTKTRRELIARDRTRRLAQFRSEGKPPTFTAKGESTACAEATWLGASPMVKTRSCSGGPLQRLVMACSLAGPIAQRLEQRTHQMVPATGKPSPGFGEIRRSLRHPWHGNAEPSCRRTGRRCRD